MHLREVLADPVLAAQLTPSMSLIEQLLRDKGNLSGVALANAKSLIRRFVDEVAEVLRTEVEKATAGELDRSVPPKRVFRNLDLDRTIWKNLTNWSPEEERLYVDRLYYRHTARKTMPQRLIVVVDQSGSMTDSMVNCTILASIFAGLPKVDVHLIAYDTQALDLTPWVHDPFETLLRTHLGGGNDGMVAMALAQPKIAEPRQHRGGVDLGLLRDADRAALRGHGRDPPLGGPVHPGRLGDQCRARQCQPVVPGAVQGPRDAGDLRPHPQARP